VSLTDEYGWSSSLCVHPKAKLQRRFALRLKIVLVIARLEETCLPIVAALNYMLGDAHEIESLHPWHCRLRLPTAIIASQRC
jgi:hypothetical protein